MDIGTSSVRAGYAGEDTPRCMFPTSFGYLEQRQQQEGEDVSMDIKRQYYIGDNKINKLKSHMEIRHPLKDGISKIHIQNIQQ